MSDEQINDILNKEDDLAGKYLTFKLGNETYGIEILKVQEIIKMMDITRVPRTPAFMKGVINLRGKVIPVMNLRLKFGMEEVDETEKTCVIVVQVKTGKGTTVIGVIVDEVSEVMDIPEEAIEPTPPVGANVDTEYILGMAKSKNDVNMLLDIDRILAIEELNHMEGAA